MTREKLEDVADYVIIGTGAGGATAARVLAGAGHDVLMLEEGPLFRTAERPRDITEAMCECFRDFGTQATRGDHVMPLLQARMVGGSTAINSGIIWRMPEDVRTDWSENWGLGELLEKNALQRTFETLERELQIEETPEALFGENGRLMREASEKLGLPGKAMARNTPSCCGSSECLYGCAREARQSMDVSYIPRAQKDGARLHTLLRANKILIEGNRAVGVQGDILEKSTQRVRGHFTIRARRAVIVAAGVVHTPIVLRQSGLRGMVGERFQAHPGASVVARFPKPVSMARGATQSWEVPLRERRMKLESLSMVPEMLAVRIPGAGAPWQERLAELDHYAQWVTLVRMRAHGSIRPTLFGGVNARYVPLPEDIATMREGVALLCKMFFIAGATEVYPGVARRPQILKDISEVRALEEGELSHDDFHMVASHLFGTACAGSDPSRSVVDPNLQAHGISGLYVMDASVFPTNLGVNPQHSIMAVVHRAAERLANAA